MENNRLLNRVKPYIHTQLFRNFKMFQSIIFAVILSATMVGCVTFNDPETSQEFTSDRVATIDSQTTIGQTFISRRPRLNGITIWISSEPDHINSLTGNSLSYLDVDLFHSPADAAPIFTETVFPSLSSTSIPYTIKLPDLGRSPGENYFVRLSTSSSQIHVYGRNEDSYPGGQVYINDQPRYSDLAFKASYEYNSTALLEDIKQAGKHFPLVLPLLVILWLPGWLLLEFSGLHYRFDFGERIALSIGISLTIIPVIMLWTTILKITWTRNALLVISTLFIGALIFRVFYKIFISKRNKPITDINSPNSIPNTSQTSNIHLGGAFLITCIFIITLTVRLVMVRDLATPAWVDSVHHALLTRLILSNGSYPTDYSPYLNISTASYHLGFHSIAAAFTWLSGLKLDQSLLLLGQVLNGLLVFSVYLFAKTLTRSTNAGLISAVLTGFLTPMPAYYTSWGRYTELTGLLILPTAFVFLQSLSKQKFNNQHYWIIFLGALTCAGLFMIHYRVVVFLAGLTLAYIVVYLLIEKNSPYSAFHDLFHIVIIAGLSMALVSPWLYQTITHTLLPLGNLSNTRREPFFQDFSWAYLTSALGKQTLVFAGLGLMWGIIKQKRFAYLLLLWVFLIFLIANLGALGLPGSGLISSSSVEIMLFIPISVLGGYLLDQIFISWKSLLPIHYHGIITGALLVIMGTFALVGSRQLVTIINPTTILSRNADIQAMEWVQNNIPESETIVINPFAWGYGVYAGYDGGYWISPLTGRETIPPPVLYGLGPDSKQIIEQCKKIVDLSSDPKALQAYLISNQLHYIYIGARGGIISPARLLSSDLFIPRFHHGGVWIFQVKP